MQIHPTAIVGADAEIDEEAVVGPFCIVGDGVKVAGGTRLISNVVIDEHTEIGSDCVIHPFAGIGFPPQDLKYDGRKTGVKIGNNTIIREYATVHRASVGGDGLTEIGNGCFIMAYVHVAHDCKVGNQVVMANAAMLAGHVVVEDHAVLGGVVAIHQFTRIGAYAMVGGFSGIAQDVPPFTIASGPRAKLFGLNSIGLKRKGFTDEQIQNLKKAYKILFRDKIPLKEAIKRVEHEMDMTDDIKRLIEFISNNKRGVCRMT